MGAHASILHGRDRLARRRIVTAAALACVCLAAGRPATAFPDMRRQRPAPASAAEPGLHAMRGVVVSVTSTTLVVRRSGLRRVEMTFTLKEATARDGAVVTGALVAVRYRIADGTLVATAIVVRRSSFSGDR